jgi:hypothetical protein
LLGVGSFGVVLEVRNLSSGQISALKVNLLFDFVDNQSNQPRAIQDNAK